MNVENPRGGHAGTTLHEQLLSSGVKLFQRRSYLPLLLLPPVVLGLMSLHASRRSPLLDLPWEIGCFILGLLGLMIRIVTIGYASTGTSGRGTTMPRARDLTTSGMYAVMRHPLYFGNYLMWLSVALLSRTWYVPVIATLVFWMCWERIMLAEEEVLQKTFGDEFLAWARTTPTILPAFRKWSRPVLPFSWRVALRREYHGLFGLVLVFTLVEMFEDLMLSGKVLIDWFWAVTFIATALTYGVTRFLTKQTRMLHMEGR